MSNITWGLQRDITPRLGARLVQEGNQLHYLADRASITGKFSDVECRKLDETIPAMPTASPCTTMVSPAKPTPLAVAATYTSPFIPLNDN